MVKWWMMAILAVISATASGTENKILNEDIQKFYFTQPLDHFDNNNNRTWQMPFYFNVNTAVGEAPVIIFIRICTSPKLVTQGPLYNIAKEIGAVLLVVGTRFYCENRPVDIMTNENLKYLNAEQTIADLILLVREIRRDLLNSNIILAGCTSTAVVATWLNRINPGLVDGVLASSANLEAKADFYEANEIIGQAIKKIGGDKCYDRIQRGIATLEYMFDYNYGEEAKSILPLCHSFDIHSDKDISMLFYGIAQIVFVLVNNNRQEIIKELCNETSETIDESSDIDVIKNLLNTAKNLTSTECLDFSYYTFLTMLKDASFDINEDRATYSALYKIGSVPTQNVLRPYFYEGCNQLGQFPTTTSSNQPFGTKNPLTFFTTLCADAFGDEFTYNYIQRKIADTNYLFNGRKPDVENIYFTYGELDPFKVVGVEDGKQVIIPNSGPCADILSGRNTSEMQALRKNISDFIHTWIIGTVPSF